MSKSGPTNELSIDVDSALASAASAPAPETPSHSGDDSDDSSSGSTPEFFADDQDDADVNEGEDSEESTDADEEFLEVTAYGKSHKVSLSDKEKLKQLLSLGLSAPKAFNKSAKLAQENKKLQRELEAAQSDREKAKIWDKLEAVKDDENELFRLISGGKRTLDDVVEDKIKKRQAYQAASPEDQVKMLADEREKMLLKEIERMRAQSTMEKQEAERRSADADQKNAHAQAYPEFQRVFRALNIKDPVESQEVAADLWELGFARIGRLAKQAEERKEDFDLTPAVVRQNFEAVAKRWGYTQKKQSKQQAKQVLESKSKDATRRAGQAATKNYKTADLTDLENLSPTKAFERLFGNRRK